MNDTPNTLGNSKGFKSSVPESGDKDHIHFPLFRFYLFEREREHKQGEKQAEGEGEAGSQLSREPNMGFNPRT